MAPKQRLVHVPSVVVEQPTAVTNEREGTYKPVRVVVRTPDEYQRCLQELLTQIRALEKTVHELRSMAGEQVTMLPTLIDAMQVAKDTVRLMLDTAG
jgi:hypothetical protein